MSDSSAADQGRPFEEQQEIYELLSQETRHLVLQYILGHPEHLPSLDELTYLLPKNKAAIREQLQRLRTEGIVDRYDHSPNEETRDLPSQFYGLTLQGVEILDEYNYLRGVPVARAVYDNVRLSERAERHLNAPRPELPEDVDRSLRIENDQKSGDFDRLVDYIREHNDDAPSLDEQIDIVKAFYRNDVGPDHEGFKRAEVMEELEPKLQYQPRTVLRNLVDIGILEEETPAGPGVFAISERTDEIVNGHVTREAEENIEALIRHMDDELQTYRLEDNAAEWTNQEPPVTAPSVALADGAGRTVRSIIAETFGTAPEQVAEYLRSGEPVNRLNAAVKAIESSEEVKKSEEYGRILFVSPAYRYRLSQTAVELL